jgi:hypothetical protein
MVVRTSEAILAMTRSGQAGAGIVAAKARQGENVDLRADGCSASWWGKRREKQFLMGKVTLTQDVQQATSPCCTCDSCVHVKISIEGHLGDAISVRGAVQSGPTAHPWSNSATRPGTELEHNKPPSSTRGLETVHQATDTASQISISHGAHLLDLRFWASDYFLGSLWTGVGTMQEAPRVGFLAS